MSQENKIFKEFTNQYELSKTLRFELKPLLETPRLLEENHVFQKDELIKKKYEKTKIYFDRLHREFVSESLQDLKFSDEDLENYENALNELNKDKKNNTFQKNIEKQEKNLRKIVVEKFDITGEIWAERYNEIARKNAEEKGEKFTDVIKKKNKDFLHEKSIFEYVLLEKYGKNEAGENNLETIEEVEIKKIDKKTGEITTEKIEQSIFKGWKGFTGYFGKFFETRKNFYKADGTSTAIATRIIDQNLRRFVDNKNLIKNYSQKFLDSLDLPIEDFELLKDIKYYTQFALQGERKIKDEESVEDKNPTHIFLYNNLVGRVKSAINAFKQNPENKDEMDEVQKSHISRL